MSTIKDNNFVFHKKNKSYFTVCWILLIRLKVYCYNFCSFQENPKTVSTFCFKKGGANVGMSQIIQTMSTIHCAAVNTPVVSYVGYTKCLGEVLVNLTSKIEFVTSKTSQYVTCCSTS